MIFQSLTILKQFDKKNWRWVWLFVTVVKSKLFRQQSNNNNSTTANKLGLSMSMLFWSTWRNTLASSKYQILIRAGGTTLSISFQTFVMLGWVELWLSCGCDKIPFKLDVSACHIWGLGQSLEVYNYTICFVDTGTKAILESKQRM